MRKFRDSGPIHTLPQRVTVAVGQTTAELVVGSVPMDPTTETASHHQQVSAHTTDGNLADVPAGLPHQMQCLIRVAPVPGTTPVDLDWIQIAQA